MGSGDTAEGFGGDWRSASGDGGEPDDAGFPGASGEGELESVLRPVVFGICIARSVDVRVGPEGDGGDHLDGVRCGVSTGARDLSRSGRVGVGALGGRAWGRRAYGSSDAGPLVVPDVGHGFSVGVTGIADGTEGFAPAVSVGEDRGGEGTPSTGGLGGGETGPELLGSWGGDEGWDGGRRLVACNLFGGGPDVAAVVGWHPWRVWKWWDGWGLWWAEEGGEGVLLGVLLEDSDVGIPGGLGGVVSAEGGGVLAGERATGGPDGLGDLGWEVSHLSQIKFDAVVCTVVLVGAQGVGGRAHDVAGHWDVGDVTVELGLDERELEADSRGVDDWCLTWGHPVGGHTGDVISCGGSLSVPGSEGGELLGWHPEEWDIVTKGESWCHLLLSSSICSRHLEALHFGVPVSCGDGVLHVVDGIGARCESKLSGRGGVHHGEGGGSESRPDDPGALVVDREASKSHDVVFGLKDGS